MACKLCPNTIFTNEEQIILHKEKMHPQAQTIPTIKVDGIK